LNGVIHHRDNIETTNSGDGKKGLGAKKKKNRGKDGKEPSRSFRSSKGVQSFKKENGPHILTVRMSASIGQGGRRRETINTKKGGEGVFGGKDGRYLGCGAD